jgi:O-methyltransferase involved in polyketide biosynthesis
MTPPPEPAPAAVAAPDVTRPNIARAYDYLLGGKDHFPADRDLAHRLLAIYPGVRQMVRENRRFLVRALDYVLVQGVRQYVDLGAGLPTSPAVHDIVRRHSTGPVLYVDNDPVVVNHLWALACSPSPHVHALPADLTTPATVIRQIREGGLIDLAQPVCLILAMVLHFMDAPAARDLVAAYVSELAPGSHVIITAGAGAPAIGDQITATYDAAPLYNHSRDDVAGFFTGLDLVDPGIADARAWQPGWRTPAPFFDRAGQVLAGVGVKP